MFWGIKYLEYGSLIGPVMSQSDIFGSSIVHDCMGDGAFWSIVLMWNVVYIIENI